MGKNLPMLIRNGKRSSYKSKFIIPPLAIHTHPEAGEVAAPSAGGGVWPGQAMMCSRILSILSMAEASVSRMSLGSQQFTRPAELVDEGIRLFPSNRDITTNFPFACASWCRCQSPDRSAGEPRATVWTHIKP